MSLLQLGTAPLRLGAVMAASRGAGGVALSPEARGAVEAARRVVERYAAGDEPVYGINTGLGGNVGFRLARADIEGFQAQMVRGRCIGVGEPFPEATCRTMVLCRLIGLAQGGSGISPAILDLMIALFNAGITPVIPGRGSIGAGDLGLCAHIGAAVIGEGEVWVAGRRQQAASALAAVGLAPGVLGAKDGLAIINSSAVTCGHAAEVLAELADVLAMSIAVAALSDEGYAANPRIFDARLAAARPARGQEQAARAFRAALAGSSLHDDGAARSIQDALCFRVLSQVYGPAMASFETAAASVETEINAAADNPLVMAADDLILSSANFHTPDIALTMDTMAIAVCHLAGASAYRTIKLMSATLTGLPKYLSPVGGASNGYNAMQKTVAALHGEIRLKAAPASTDAIPVSDTVEDHAPQTPLTIRKLAEQIVPLRLLFAIEALVAAQAVDLRRPLRLGRITGRLHEAIRARVPMLGADRANGPDADAVAAILGSPDLVAEIRHGIGDATVFASG